MRTCIFSIILGGFVPSRDTLQSLYVCVGMNFRGSNGMVATIFGHIVHTWCILQMGWWWTDRRRGRRPMHSQITAATANCLFSIHNGLHPVFRWLNGITRLRSVCRTYDFSHLRVSGYVSLCYTQVSWRFGFIIEERWPFTLPIRRIMRSENNQMGQLCVCPKATLTTDHNSNLPQNMSSVVVDINKDKTCVEDPTFDWIIAAFGQTFSIFRQGDV